MDRDWLALVAGGAILLLVIVFIVLPLISITLGGAEITPFLGGV